MEQLSALIPQYLLDEVASRDSVQGDAATTSLNSHSVAMNSSNKEAGAVAERSNYQEAPYQYPATQEGVGQEGFSVSHQSGEDTPLASSSSSGSDSDNQYDSDDSYGPCSELVVFNLAEPNSPQSDGTDYSRDDYPASQELEERPEQLDTPAEYSFADSSRDERGSSAAQEGYDRSSNLPFLDKIIETGSNKHGLSHQGRTEIVSQSDEVDPNKELSERFSSGWTEAKARLQSTVDPGLFLAWLKPLVFLKVGPKISNGHETYEVVLGAPNRFSTEHVTRRYSSLIIEHLSAAAGFVSSEVSLRVGVGRGEASRQSEQKHQSLGPSSNRSEQLSQATSAGSELNRVMSSAITSSSAELKRISAPRRAGSTDRSDSIQANECGLNPKYNFSNFVVGGCNQFAHAVCLRVSEDLGGNYNPLFIYGGVGLGKTHLANAIGNASRRRGKRVLLVSSELFVSELISALRSNKMQAFKNRFRSLDLLIVDDIQFIIGKERTQEEFFHTFNELHQKHKQIVMTSDKMPQDLIGLEERLKTRFASGISADLQAPDFETRVAILIRKSEQSSIQLPVEVARLLAERIDTNVRELEGALNRIQAFSSLYHEPITVDLAQSVLKTVAPEKSREVSPEQIQRIVGERFSIGLSDIIGKRRTQNIALARQVAMYLCRKLTPSSYPEIGALFGGRDHSTVIHANKVIEERIRTDEEFGRDIQAIERRLRGQ